jgi:uncharacterized membrane protein (DUF373 family)
VRFRRAEAQDAVHNDVHGLLSRYFELAQDAIAAALAVVVLVVMAQGLWTLAVVALVQGREPRVILPQIVFLLILVELFRTLLFYLREHRVAVGLMVEVSIVGVLRELLLNPPGTKLFDATGLALLLFVLGALLVADRVTAQREDGNQTPGTPRH